MYPLTPWVRRLLVANVVVYLAQGAVGGLTEALILVPAWVLFRPWTVITYMFLHAGFVHLLFNMIILFFFGPRLEGRIGSRSFLLLYMGSGLGAAVLSALFTPTAAILGASGAVYGVMAAFATYWPREEIYIWGVLPVQARWLILLMAGAALFFGVTGTRSGVAHFAHLGGAAVGFLHLKIRDWRMGRASREFRRKVQATPSAGGSDRKNRARWEAIDLERLHEINREEVERLLGKVRDEGVRALSEQERTFLDRMAG